jgi:hypothetical protein
MELAHHSAAPDAKKQESPILNIRHTASAEGPNCLIVKAAHSARDSRDASNLG